MSARVDLVALHREEYAAGRAPRMVAVAPARFLALDGTGELAGPAFDAAARALAAVARAVRARVRRETGKDFRLPPLEALLGDRLRPGTPFAAGRTAGFRLLVRVPAFVRPADLAAIGEAAGDGTGPAPAARLEEIREGRCLQSLHVGPVAGLAAAVERLRGAAADQGLEPRGRLHCAWPSGPGRASPDRQRTLVRLPVKPR
jgi:hypothetical protein